MKICQVVRCEKKSVKKDFCDNHYQLDRKGYLFNELIGYERGDAFGNVTRLKKHSAFSDATTGKPRDAVPTYGAMHKRLYKALGSASHYQCCEPCTEPHSASDWALKPGAGTHLGTNRGLPAWYAITEDAYQPMCRKHHKLMDTHYRAGRSTSVDESKDYEPAGVGGQ